MMEIIVIFTVLVLTCIVIVGPFLILNLHKAKKMNIEMSLFQIIDLKVHGVEIKDALFTIRSSKDFGVDISPTLLVLLKSKGGSVCDLVDILSTQSEIDAIDLLCALEIFLSKVLTGSGNEEVNEIAYGFFKWNCCFTGHELPDD